jgi:hypothetical protein
MQKYRSSEFLDALVDGEPVACDLDHEQPVYRASDVEARIAELEKILRLCFFNMYPAGTKYEDAYADSLKASNELMESVTK